MRLWAEKEMRNLKRFDVINFLINVWDVGTTKILLNSAENKPRDMIFIG